MELIRAVTVSTLDPETDLLSCTTYLVPDEWEPPAEWRIASGAWVDVDAIPADFVESVGGLSVDFMDP